LKNVVRGYEESWGFPNCGGAIDGTHIPIIAPSESHGDYLNRKGYYSLYTCNSIWSVIKMSLKRKAGQKRGAAWSDDETRLREQSYSLIMQGVCDNKYIFRDINIGWPGRVHDARVFVNSEIEEASQYKVIATCF
jgi:hypothetical protein